MSEDAKDQFYSRLQNILEKCRENDVTNLVGDFKVIIRIDNNGYEEVMVLQR